MLEGVLASTFAGDNAGVKDVAFTPNELQIASVGSEMNVRLWDVESGGTGGTETEQNGHASAVLAAAYTLDGDTVHSVGDNLSLRK